MYFVLDATITAAWAMPGEGNELADSLLSMVQIDGAIVPMVWWYEIRNILSLAERRHRITAADALAFLKHLDFLDIKMRELGEGKELMRLARVHQLSVHQAAYLELALRENLPLATLNRDLAMAAVKESVPPIAL